MNSKYTFVVLFVALLCVVMYSEAGNKITGDRSTIISGDTVALHSADTSSRKWVDCTKGSCTWTNCPASAAINSKERKPCSNGTMFIIKGKKEGRRAIVSGGTVSLSSVNYGPGFLLGCNYSMITPCSMKSTNSQLRGNQWLKHADATFQIFSRDAKPDGTAVRNGDLVGFKYPYSSNGAWLASKNGQFYPRNCSKISKEPCAAKNKPTGFYIFKKT